MSPSQKRNEQNKRLDYWLWSARFYKTRTLANTAIKSGKVSSEGIRLKPSHQLKGGELLEIKKNPYCWKIRVLDFPRHEALLNRPALSTGKLLKVELKEKNYLHN